VTLSIVTPIIKAALFRTAGFEATRLLTALVVPTRILAAGIWAALATLR
jgi:hypothetical protein